MEDEKDTRIVELERTVNELYNCYEKLEENILVTSPKLRELSAKAVELFNDAEIPADI